MILASNGILPLYKGLAFDFQFPKDPIVTNETLGLYLNATFFNQTLGYTVPMKTPITDMALNFTYKNEVMVDTSLYAVDSVWLTLHNSNHLNITITQELLGPV